MFGDLTGNEFVQMQQSVSTAIEAARAKLLEHDITIYKVNSEKVADPTTFDTLYQVQLGFLSLEDYIMAKITLNPKIY